VGGQLEKGKNNNNNNNKTSGKFRWKNHCEYKEKKMKTDKQKTRKKLGKK